MKKLLIILFCLILSLSVISCGNEAGGQQDNVNPDGGTDTALETEASSGRKVTSIYGMFDEQYDFIYEDICLVPGTFTQKNPVYSIIEKYDSSLDRSSVDALSKRLPAIIVLSKELSLTEVDLNEYFTACFETGITDIMPSSEVMKAIVSEDEAKAAELCVHPSALAKDGKVYTLRMLLEGKAEGVSDKEIKATVDKAKAYYGAELLKSDRLSDTMREKLSELGYEVIKASAGTLCTIHSDEYHSIPSQLEAMVDADALKSWKENLKADECGAKGNIADFVRQLNVSKESFIELYNSLGGTLGHYNIDAIYGENAEEYYSQKHTDYVKCVEADRAMAGLKEKVAKDTGMDDFVTNVHEFSLAEILLMINRDEAYIKELGEYMQTVVSMPEIDIASIYDNGTEYINLISKRSPYYIDCQASGRIAFPTPYDAHRTLG